MNRVVAIVMAFAYFITLKSVLADEEPWVLQQYDVCFGAKGKNFGKFRLNRNGALYALKLVHRSGYVSCYDADVNILCF